MSSNHYRGIVLAILSGDSLIVKFIDQIPNSQIQVVCLRGLVAPKFGRNDGKICDEPHGYASWEFLRDRCIGRRVCIPKTYQQSDQIRHHASFGGLPTIFSQVSLYDECNADLGSLACEAGWVRLRPSKNCPPYIQHLQEMENLAKKAMRGIWAPNGFVRPLPVSYDPQALLKMKEVEVIIENIRHPTQFFAFIHPTHEYITVRLAGVRTPTIPYNDKESLFQEAINEMRNSYLHRKVKLILHTVNEDKIFTGCFQQKYNSRILEIMRKGLILFNQRSSELCISPNSFVAAQAEAMKMSAGYFATSYGKEYLEKHNKPKPEVIEGRIASILGSDKVLIVMADDQRKLVVFSSIQLPRFSMYVGSEPLGFEAREFIRKNFLGQNAVIIVDGYIDERYYGTVYVNQVCINEVLVREGFAKVCDPPIGKPSKLLHNLKILENRAQSAYKGIHGDLPPPKNFVDGSDFVATDSELFDSDSIEFSEATGESTKMVKNQTFDAIIEQIISGTKYRISIPSMDISVDAGLNGILAHHTYDRLGLEAKSFCYKHFLQRDVKVTVLQFDKYNTVYTKMESEQGDLAVLLLEAGLAEIHHRILNEGTAPQEHIDAQNRAKLNNMPIWSDNTGRYYEPPKDVIHTVFPVAVWNPLVISVQFQLDAIFNISTKLQSGLEPFKGNLMKNDAIAVRHGTSFFRGRIQSVTDNEVVVDLLEHGHSIAVELSDIYVLPPELKTDPPYSLKVMLAFLTANGDLKTGSDLLWSQIEDKRLYLRVVKEGHLPLVVISLDKDLLSKPTINEFMANSETVTALPATPEDKEEWYYPIQKKILHIEDEVPQNDCKLNM